MNKYLSRYFFYYPVTLAHGEFIYKYSRHAERFQWQSRQYIEDYQLQALQRLLKHAQQHVPFYKRTYATQNIDNLSSLAQLEQLPIITKQDIIEHFADLCADKSYFFTTDKTTGGSTGQAVTVRKNADALARERAVTWRSYRWAGVDIGAAQIRFWGVPLAQLNQLKYKLIDFIANRKRISAFDINDQTLTKYCDIIHKFKPAYIYGYVSAIKEFALFLKRKGRQLPTSIKSIITTSEVLDDLTRQQIESSAGLQIFNEYGCGEVGSIAHQCEHGNMHLMSDNLIVELVDEHGKPADRGEIVVTDLYNYAMPLIRYRLGDFATYSASACACGRGLPVIEGIHGRAYDMIRDEADNKYHPEIIMYIFEEFKAQNAGIAQFQVIQTDLHNLDVKIVPDQHYDNSLDQRIAQMIKDKLHPSIQIRVQHVEKIEREKSGKMRLIKSLLNT